MTTSVSGSSRARRWEWPQALAMPSQTELHPTGFEHGGQSRLLLRGFWAVPDTPRDELGPGPSRVPVRAERRQGQETTQQHTHEGPWSRWATCSMAPGSSPEAELGSSIPAALPRAELEESPQAGGGCKPLGRLVRAIKAYSCPQGRHT